MIEIKTSLEDTVIAFNNSGVPLKERSEEDLIDLALMAIRSGDKSLLRLFENLPTLDELKQMKMRTALAKTKTQ